MGPHVKSQDRPAHVPGGFVDRQRGEDAINISERARKVMTEAGDRAAISFEDRDYSWAAIDAFAQDLMRLMETADPSGAAVAVVLRNRAVGAAAMFGVIAARRTTLMVTPLQPAQNICADVRLLRPAVVIADRQDWNDDLDAAARSVGAAGAEIADLDGRLVVAMRPGLERAAPGQAAETFPGAAMVVSTSGTTGAPKRAPFGWSVLDRYARADDGLAAGRVLIQTNPLVTVGGIPVLASSVANPLHLVLMERLDVARWADLVERYKPRRAGLPPTGLRMLLASGAPKEKFASLECFTTGSAPMSADEIDAFEAAFEKPLLYSYGATELGATPVARWTLPLRAEWSVRKRGSVGRPVGGVELRVVDQATGTPLPAGEEGLLEVRRATAPTPGEDGWIRTNDLAVVDGDGFLFVRGRADDVIIRGGFKVPLPEIQAVLLQHEAVAGAAAVGLPDARLGQTPVAAVVLKPGARPPREDELIAWARERLAPYKVPTRLRIVEALPMTQLLKVSRGELRALFNEPQPPAEARFLPARRP